MTYRGRFAPSPTGRLHLGSLLAATGSWLRARAERGSWIVRIEDIDPEREVPGAADDILATLARFGMESDEPVIRQSERLDVYRAVLQRLIEQGHAYRCACTRRNLEAFGGMHPSTCVRDDDSSRPRSWRMRVGDERIRFVDGLAAEQCQDLRQDVGDFVLQRNDGWPAYQLAVVVDDDHQRITEVVRGADLLDSTPRQILLQRRLGLATPAYRHLPLILDDNGRKLSKQDHALPVDGDDPLPAMTEVLRRLGLPRIKAATPARMLDEALSHPALADSLIGGRNMR